MLRPTGKVESNAVYSMGTGRLDNGPVVKGVPGMSLSRSGDQVPAAPSPGHGDAETISRGGGRPGDQLGKAPTGAPRAGFALLLTLSMAQFMVVLDGTFPSVNMAAPWQRRRMAARVQGLAFAVRARSARMTATPHGAASCAQSLSFRAGSSQRYICRITLPRTAGLWSPAVYDAVSGRVHAAERGKPRPRIGGGAGAASGLR